MKFLLLACTSGLGANSNKYEESISLKYPVILVNGLAAQDIHSWGRIPGTLRRHGIKVFFGNTDAWGSVESNASLLKATVDRVLYETKSERVNIIAHSKGGIDSRYFIWKYNYGDRVASLTTISTPHRGAEVADAIFDERRTFARRMIERLAFIGVLYGDANPDIGNAIYHLTTKRMAEFNKTVLMDERVHFQSIYSVMENPTDDLFYALSYAFINNISGPNDGLVSEKSARWGNNIRKIEGSISHKQIIDFHRCSRTDQMDIPGIFLEIVRELGSKGF